MSNEKVPLVAPAVCNVEEKHKKKEGRGYLAYGVVATAFCMGFVAHSQAGIFTATPPPTVNLLRSSSTSGCKGWCESDRGAHSDSELCDPSSSSIMSGQCSSCGFCQPKDNCQGFCEADRGTHTDSQLCRGSGDLANLCGGCNFCQPKDDCKGWCEADRGTHTDSLLCGSVNYANLCGGCDFCQSSPSGPKVTGIKGTRWADVSDTGGCALPEFDGLYYRDDAIAVGDMMALGSMMIKTEQGHRNCGQLYNIQCTNDVGVEGPVLSSVVASTCDVEAPPSKKGGVDMITSTWKVATSGMKPGVASCTVELNKSSIFKNYEDMICTFRAKCGDCQSNPYYASVGLMNTKGKIVVSVSADGQSMRNNDGYNQFWDGNGPYNRNSKFVFTFADGNTHSCKYNELHKPSNVHTW